MAGEVQAAEFGDLFPVEEPFDQERGWRYKRVMLADGREVSYMVPLTSEDYLNPQEGDVMPQTPLHEWIAYLLTYMLRMRYLNTNVSVFHDFIINWGIPGLANPSPDISVIPDVPDPQAIEKDGVFFVKEQGTKPILVVEVVSPNYRKEDREQKVEIYERAGVPEYLIFDFYSGRGRNRAEVLLYRLAQGRYRLQTPDEDGLLYCQTVDLRVGLDEEGKLFVEDGETGEPLRTPEEERAARKAAEARVAELEAELRRLRGEG